MISDERAEEAVEYLLTSSPKAAEARAMRLHLEDYSKALKAIIMSEHLAMALGAQEREALSDGRYLEHLKALKSAIFMDEKLRNLRTASEAMLEYWRTSSANTRKV